MRRAKLRIFAYEKRMSKDGRNLIEGGVTRTICTILYNKFDFQLKKAVTSSRRPTVELVDGEVVKEDGVQGGL